MITFFDVRDTFFFRLSKRNEPRLYFTDVDLNLIALDVFHDALNVLLSLEILLITMNL